MTELAHVSDEGPDDVLEALDAALDEVAGLRKALATRAVIEQAKGIIMHRHDVDEHAAFALLVQISQRTHVKLQAVAHDVVTSRGESLPT